MLSLKERYRGLILGTAVGDAIGLPAEGFSRTRTARMFKGRWCHRFIFRHGMTSDDTEHTLFVIQCLLAHPESAEKFTGRLGWCLKWWFASLPAGIGLATARACIKLWLGFSAQNSGVYSAGNGPTMRAAPIGAFFCSSQKDLDTFISASTKITHTDPKALVGAKAVAITAAWIVRDGLEKRPSAEAFCGLLKDIAPEDSEWVNIIEKIKESLDKNATVDEFAATLKLTEGVSGYMYHTVPVALFAWHRHFGNYEETLTTVWNCGGDTDTTGAIVGALAGLTAGEKGIPADWVGGIAEWPRSIHLLRLTADRLSELKDSGSSQGPVRYFWPGILLRNTVFLLIVFGYAFRRIFPPYGNLMSVGEITAKGNNAKNA